MTFKILILGGTTEGRLLAERLAVDLRFDAILSLAGRTAYPLPQALPTRKGGFGGVEGLSDYIAEQKIGALIVATHPYADKIADNAAAAAGRSGTPTLLWERPAWSAAPGDAWREFRSLEDLADAIGTTPKRVFVTIGRQEARVFERAPQHHYLFRSVDPIDPPPDLPRAEFILERGPFDPEAEAALMQAHAIELLVTKNSGGAATHGKIEAARRLGLPVYLLARPARPSLPSVASLDEVLAWLDQLPRPKVRGE